MIIGGEQLVQSLYIFDQLLHQNPPRMALADSTTLLVICPSSHQIIILSTQPLNVKFSLVQFTQP